MNLLTQFLKKHDAYFYFCNNIQIDQNISCIDEYYIQQCDSREDQESMIDHAFRWGHTSEGYDYWEQLDNRWQDFIMDIELPLLKMQKYHVFDFKTN